MAHCQPRPPGLRGVRPSAVSQQHGSEARSYSQPLLDQPPSTVPSTSPSRSYTIDRTPRPIQRHHGGASGERSTWSWSIRNPRMGQSHLPHPTSLAKGKLGRRRISLRGLMMHWVASVAWGLWGGARDERSLDISVAVVAAVVAVAVAAAAAGSVPSPSTPPQCPRARQSSRQATPTSGGTTQSYPGGCRTPSR